MKNTGGLLPIILLDTAFPPTPNYQKSGQPVQLSSQLIIPANSMGLPANPETAARPLGSERPSSNVVLILPESHDVSAIFF